MAENEQKSSKTGNFLQEELQEEYLKSLDELEVGQLVEGTVVAITSEQVFIDVGYKSEGKINLNEFDEKPEIGDTVQVVLVNKEGRHGEVVVSKRKADEKVVWRAIKAAHTDNQPIEGKIARVVKGGFEVDLGGGNRGFNPISKIDLFRVEEPEKYLGMKTNFYIERLYSDNRVNIILSRRRWLEEVVDEKRNEFFQNTSEGDVVEGSVKSFTSFGAFVDLGGFDGLLHINDMSWGHVARPKDHVKKGEVLQLRVTRLDEENKKINLSLKDMTENPWDSFTERFQLHDVIKGKVTKLTDFGAFIELEEGIEGLAHISELSWTKRIKHPKEVINIGDEVEAKILGFDLDARKVSLGVKQVMANPWDEIEKNYPEGTKLSCVVKKITATGAFLELEEGIDGFLHVDDLSWTKKYKNPGAVLTEGESVDVVIIESSAESHNIRLGIKQLEKDPWRDLKGAYSEGSIIEGEVTNVTDFGVFVRVEGGIEGLIPKVHLGNPRELNLDDEITKFKEGQKVTAAIIELNPGRQKLSLSIREMTRAQERQEIEKYIADNGTEEASATLADFMKQDDE
jgi:small subunit ribosomal protein S1